MRRRWARRCAAVRFRNRGSEQSGEGAGQLLLPRRSALLQEKCSSPGELLLPRRSTPLQENHSCPGLSLAPQENRSCPGELLLPRSIAPPQEDGSCLGELIPLGAEGSGGDTAADQSRPWRVLVLGKSSLRLSGARLRLKASSFATATSCCQLPASYGKSHVIRNALSLVFERALGPKGLWVPASTGLAACALDGDPN